MEETTNLIKTENSPKQINDIIKISLMVSHILFVVATFTFIAYETVNCFGIIDSYYDGYNITIYEMFELKHGTGGDLIYQVWAILGCVVGLFFIWTNKAKGALCAAISNFIFMLSTLMYNYTLSDGYKYWAIESYNDYHFVYVVEKGMYWLIWVIAIIIIILSILAIKYPQLKKETKKTVLNVADQIAKYKELLDNGIITQEEYDEKKKELLNLNNN